MRFAYSFRCVLQTDDVYKFIVRAVYKYQLLSLVSFASLMCAVNRWRLLLCCVVCLQLSPVRLFALLRAVVVLCLLIQL